MKKQKKISYLVEMSKTNGKLDSKKIAVIARILKKDDLAGYYRLLVAERRKEEVVITTAITLPDDFTRKLMKLFPQKSVSFIRNPDLIAGLKVSIADFIFDASFKTYFDRMRKTYEIN